MSVLLLAASSQLLHMAVFGRCPVHEATGWKGKNKEVATSIEVGKNKKVVWGLEMAF